MKYLFTDVEDKDKKVSRYVTFVFIESGASTFEAIEGNQHYEDFLIQANLTDKKVHALTPDVWYDFLTTGGKK